MTVLSAKLRRDLLRSRGMLLAVVLVIAAGSACFVALLSSYENLERARRRYYAAYSMADFWVDLRKCPVEEARRLLRETPGIDRVRLRISFPARVEAPESAVPVNGRLLSVPPRRESMVNGLAIRRGSYFTPGLRNQVILSEKFAAARGIAPGDTVTVVAGGERTILTVTGTAESPEFVYLAPPGSLIDDPLHYGVFYIREDFAEDLFRFEGACNSVAGTFTPRGRRRSDVLLRELSRRFDRYGVFAVYPRKEQMSAMFLDSEIRGLRSLSIILPLLFFGISALILNVLMTRIAEQQRTVVGTLKAMGYGDRSLVLHFLGFGVTAGVAGAAAGMVAGQWLAHAMTVLYRQYFTFPNLASGVYPGVLFWALAISVVFAALGTLRGLFRVLRLRPAEAMRPPAPARMNALFLERIPRVWRALGFRWQMVLRSIFRQRMRTLVALAASAAGMTILLLAFGFVDSMDSMLSFQFDRVLRGDYRVTFKDTVAGAALDEIARLPGVRRVEPLFAVQGTFQNGRVRKRAGITGLQRGGALLVPTDRSGRAVPLPEEGLLMTERMARELRVAPGESVRFFPVRGAAEELVLPVRSVVYSTLGLAVYADRRYLERVMGERSALTGAVAAFADRTSPGVRRAFLEELTRRSRIESVIDIAQEKAATKRQFDQAMRGTAVVMILFAGVILFGSILNGALISLEERRREVATLRVLGYDDGAVGALFLREILLVNLAGALLGLPLGYAALMAFVQVYQTDAYAFPGVIRPAGYLFALLLALLFALVSYAVVYRNITRLQWREALNARE